MNKITYIVYRSLENTNGITIECAFIQRCDVTGQTTFYSDNSGASQAIKAIVPKECLIIRKD